MNQYLGFALTAATVFCVNAAFVPAHAASNPDRVRGTVTAVSPSMLTINSRSGKTVKVALNGGTKYAYVVKSSLSQIKSGSYIGTATTGTGKARQALEVVVFPESMRGAGEGHYAWDNLPDPAMSSQTPVKSSMTNGNVKSAMPHNNVKSSMTNGSVKSASSAGQAGSRDITVTYKGGEKHILVPPNAPVVTLQPATAAAVTVGSKVFVKAAQTDGKVTAQFVAAGKDGVTPPM